MYQAVCGIDENKQFFSKKKKKEKNNFPLDCAPSTTETFEFVSWWFPFKDIGELEP